MEFTAHLIGSSAVSLILPIAARQIGITFTGSELEYVTPAIILGGLFPDLDHPKSKPAKYYPWISFAFFIFMAFKGKPWHGLNLAVPYLFAKLTKHRGFFHSYLLPLSLILLTWLGIIFYYFLPFRLQEVIYFLFEYYLLVPAFAFGICIHYFLDGEWPWEKRNWGLKRRKY